MSDSARPPAGQLHAGQVFHTTTTYRVERETVREFARSIQADHPAHHDLAAAQAAGYTDIVAPPTFTAVIGAALMRDSLLDPESGIDLQTHSPLHVNEKIVLASPILAGDALVASLTIVSITERAGAAIIDADTVIRTEAGNLRATVTTSSMVAPNDAKPAEPALAAAG